LLLETIDPLGKFEEADADGGWLAEAEQVAIHALVEEGIDYRGLDVSFVSSAVSGFSVEPKTHVGGAGSEQVSLRSLTAEESPQSHTRAWHAACVLTHVEMARMQLSSGVDDPDDQSAWDPQDVRRHMHDLATAAFKIGRHCQAINSAWLEEPARRHFRDE